MTREYLIAVVQSLFNEKNQAILTGDESRLGSLFSRDESGKKAEFTARRLLQARQSAMEARGTRCLSQATRVTVNSEVLTGNLVRLWAGEEVEWRSQGKTGDEEGNHEHPDILKESQHYWHQLLLEKAGKWQIKEDNCRTESTVPTIPCPLKISGPIPGKIQGATRYRAIRYDRRAAVDYANRWWQSANPAFRAFSVDCTNYVSQVIHAGGIHMNHTGKQNTGWWYTGGGGASDRWSYSWSVAHSLRWYLYSGKSHFPVEEKSSPRELLPGDIICYDWDGDGVWQHNTVVVGYTPQGQPLINAHTVSSRNRFWDYRDSLAWTEQTRYQFWHIKD